MKLQNLFEKVAISAVGAICVYIGVQIRSLTENVIELKINQGVLIERSGNLKSDIDDGRRFADDMDKRLRAIERRN